MILETAIDKYLEDSPKAIGRTKAQVLRSTDEFEVANTLCADRTPDRRRRAASDRSQRCFIGLIARRQPPQDRLGGTHDHRDAEMVTGAKAAEPPRRDYHLMSSDTRCYELSRDRSGCGARGCWMRDPPKGICIDRMIGRGMNAFSQGAVRTVLAPQLYDKWDYHRENDDFRAAVSRKNAMVAPLDFGAACREPKPAIDSAVPRVLADRKCIV